jgi:hypothetical protein
MHRSRTKLTGAVVLVLSGLGQAQICEPGWSDEFALGGTLPFVRCLTVFDDGAGPALYVGGNFHHAGGIAASRIARWDGLRWSALGDGDSESLLVAAMTVFDDDGDGPNPPALIVGGSFSLMGGVGAHNLARWDGQSWSAMGAGVTKCNAEVVRGLAVYDDGTGPALYATGFFCESGGAPAAGLVRWDGQAWTEVGGGLTDQDPDDEIPAGGRALAVYDAGEGPVLVVGGQFTRAGEVPAMNIAAWNGHGWKALGDGLGGSGEAWSYVFSLLVFDEGDGPELVAGGQFLNSGGVPLANLARWDGAAWSSPPGSEVLSDHYALALTTHENDDGRRMYVGAWSAGNGGFVARSGDDGLETITANPDASKVRALASADLGDGPRLYAGGEISQIGGAKADNIAMWDSASWEPLLPGGVDGSIRKLRVLDDGGGPRLYAIGSFWQIHGDKVSSLAVWDGTTWSGFGDAYLWPEDVAIFDDGSGPALYTAGFNLDHEGVFRWDGATWLPIGMRLWVCTSLAIYDDGQGPALYVGGSFPDDGIGLPMGIARLRDGQWEPVGGDLGDEQWPAHVWDLEVFDDGSGSALYAGGSFFAAGGQPIQGLARWDGASWTALGAGLLGDNANDPPWPAGVTVLAVADDGSGPALFAGGSFKLAEDPSVRSLARWNGKWSSLGGESILTNDFCGFRDTEGTRLVVAGPFSEVGGVATRGLASWDGQSWSSFGGGVTGGNWGEALATITADGRPGLVVAGGFQQLGGVPSESIGIWLGCPPPCPADCDLSGSLDLLDYLCFSALFDAADPAADCDGSGSLDLFDFLCFVNAFNGGCP